MNINKQWTVYLLLFIVWYVNKFYEATINTITINRMLCNGS